ncbi:MAG: oxalate:formate antiporter [Gemmatimonadaceae bacterium]|nr:oxalate:formate antiporter [Gemmatimonadaceae bacterium]
MADDVRFSSAASSATSPAENSHKGWVMLSWTFVLVPLAWGFTQTLIKAAALFT